jgi:hypothetical protein
MSSRAGTAWIILAILGLMAGLAIGLLLGWIVWPQLGGVGVADLAPQYKDDYIAMVSAAYAQDHNLDEARSRLDALQVPNAAQSVADLAATYIAKGRDPREARALVELADGLGIADASMLAYIATATPLPTATPSPTPVPTDTPVPPTDTPEPTLIPTDTPIPPTDTSVPPTATRPRPPAAKPKAPTATPTKKAQVPKWTWDLWLMGPANSGNQSCGGGDLNIYVTVVDAAGNQIPGVWVYDKYTNLYQVSGSKPERGAGALEFVYGGGGGGSLCIAASQGGPCVTGYTRDMPTGKLPSFEDKWAAGYCGCCVLEGAAENKELCRQLYQSGHSCIAHPGGHYSWQVIFKRNY